MPFDPESLTGVPGLQLMLSIPTDGSLAVQTADVEGVVVASALDSRGQPQILVVPFLESPFEENPFIPDDTSMMMAGTDNGGVWVALADVKKLKRPPNGS